MRTARAFLAGLGIAYLFDPEAGKRRRHVLRDRTLRLVRRTGRFAAKRARFLSGIAVGLVARARRRAVEPQRAVDDGTVAQRIRSEALRGAGVSTRDVEVEVRDGIVVLRGKVENGSLAEDLVSRVRGVPGVRGVESALDVATSGV